MENYFVQEVKQILENARGRAYSAINFAMVEAYWLAGKRIVEEEQNGKERAEYGQFILKTLSKELTKSLGKGFSERSIREFRQFYLTFPELIPIQQTSSEDSNFPIRRTVFAELENTLQHTLFSKLSWSHFHKIMRVQNEKARNYYIKEAAENNWSVRTLDRNISTLYYERLLSSQNQEPVIKEMNEKTIEGTNE